MPRGKLWHPHEDAALSELLKDGLPDDMPGWDLIAEQLPSDVAVRTGRASQTRAAMLGLREAPRRQAKIGCDWRQAARYRPESRGDRQRGCADGQAARKRPAPSPVAVGPMMQS